MLLLLLFGSTFAGNCKIIQGPNSLFLNFFNQISIELIKPKCLNQNEILYFPGYFESIRKADHNFEMQGISLTNECHKFVRRSSSHLSTVMFRGTPCGIFYFSTTNI